MAISSEARLVGMSRNVASLERSVLFYCERLGFTVTGPAYPANSALIKWMGCGGALIFAQMLQLGANKLELVEVGVRGKPYPDLALSSDPMFQHIAIRCADIDAACKILLLPMQEVSAARTITRVTADGGSTLAVKLPFSSGGASAFKFRDPDGHPLELIQFVKENFDVDKLSIGIDHSAISVQDPDRSIEFYNALLGMHVTERNLNRGPEQCQLDNLNYAEVDVIALSSATGSAMHLELLGYRDAPSLRDRHAEPFHSPADIGSDRLVFVSKATNVVSSFAHEDDQIKFFTDPDGHFLMLTPGDAHWT